MEHLSQISTTGDFYQFLKVVCVWLKTFLYFDFLLFLKYFLACLVVHWVASASLGWLAAAVCCKTLYDTWGSRNKAAGTPEADKRKPAYPSGQSLESSFNGETTKWLNKIIHQLWPYIGEYVYDTLKFYMEPLWFDDISIGDTPFSLNNIKVLDTTEEIVLDMNILYRGNAKITTGMALHLNNLKIEGRMRVVLKPLLPQIPFIGGLQVSFLEEPDITFTICLLNVLPMRFCSVNENVRKKIIANLMVAPKCWSKRLVEDIPIEEFENISPAAQRVEQQSDNGEGRQRAMEVAQECDNTPEEGDTLEGAGEVGTSLYLSQDTPTPAADEVDAPTNQRHLSSSGSLGRIKLSVHHGTRNNLVVLIHCVEILRNEQGRELPDMYVQLYLLPKRNKKSKRAKKLEYDDRFEYELPLREDATLEVTIIISKKHKKRSVLGQVCLPRRLLESEIVEQWYDLCPCEDRDK
ncbi:hypothetical protein O3P69_012262 [Scylla paramamosain]|uniref:C2 domain-containing protein n=3 Tax=Scylla paramamosain TaxID=85552 RepID=A0AAW0TFJ1_SCYPA